MNKNNLSTEIQSVRRHTNNNSVSWLRAANEDGAYSIYFG